MKMAENKVEKYSKYEKARLVGARALMIKMGAPVLIDLPEGVKRPIDIAKLELEKDVLPITVRRKHTTFSK